jgi:protein-disulfide isomerase
MNKHQEPSKKHVDLSQDVAARDHVRGEASATVTLLEYGDFDCPYCAAAHPVVRALETHFGAALRFVFRHNPRGELHAHAQIAARAAEAAALQGRFWEMHDRLFEKHDAHDEAALVAHAAALGLDGERFALDLHSPAVLARVREDEVSGLRSGVVGTPTFFVDGQHFHDGPDFETLSRVIVQRIARVSPAEAARLSPRSPHVDGSGHMDPQYRARLLAESGKLAEPSDERAFLRGPRAADAFAEALGEEFVETATSGEDEAEDVFNQEVAEDAGGPFVETSGRKEFAHGTDASNIPGATREPFPKT